MPKHHHCRTGMVRGNKKESIRMVDEKGFGNVGLTLRVTLSPVCSGKWRDKFTSWCAARGIVASRLGDGVQDEHCGEVRLVWYDYLVGFDQDRPEAYSSLKAELDESTGYSIGDDLYRRPTIQEISFVLDVPLPHCGSGQGSESTGSRRTVRESRMPKSERIAARERTGGDGLLALTDAILERYRWVTPSEIRALYDAGFSVPDAIAAIASI